MAFLRIEPFAGQTVNVAFATQINAAGTPADDTAAEAATADVAAAPTADATAAGVEATTTTDVTAETEGATQEPSGLAAIFGNPLFMFVIIIAIMYFLMIRPQRKRQKEAENFRRSLQPGMEVFTAAGFYGKIKEIDGDVAVIEIAHNVNVRFSLAAVYPSSAAAQENAK